MEILIFKSYFQKNCAGDLTEVVDAFVETVERHSKAR